MLIEDYLSENIHGLICRNDGEATGECPWCGKGRDHFYIHIADDERQGRWICFSCHEKGDLWKLLGHLEGLSIGAAKAWWMVRQQEAPPTNIDKVRRRVLALRQRSVASPIDTALPYGFKRVKRRRPKVLAERGVTLRTAREYGLGYCPEGDFAGRVVFPIACPLGRSWTARAVSDSMSPKYWGGDGAGRLLHGWDVAFRNGVPSKLVICEGPMDVLSLYQAGVPAVAVMSKAINEVRAALLRRTGAHLLVALDAEAATEALGVSEALGSADVVLLKSGDPGDTSPDVLIKSISGALRRADAACTVYRRRVNHLRQKGLSSVL